MLETQLHSQDYAPPADAGLHEAVLAIFLRHEALEMAAPSEVDCLSFIRDHYQIVRLDSSTASDPALQFLATPFIETAVRGHRALAEASLPTASDPGEQASTRSRAIAAATVAGAGTILSPFTGMREAVHSSVGREWYLHKHGDEVCLASQIGVTMVMVDLETAWVFPARQLIVYINAGISPAEIIAETARTYLMCLSHAAAYVAYLASGNERSIALMDFFCPHIAHNLWNVQTGWANTLRLADCSRISEFITFDRQDFFGSLVELFPETVQASSVVTYVIREEDIFLRMMSRNLLLFTVKDEFFTTDFIARVLGRARKSCSAKFVAQVDELKAATWPLIVATVRLNNRAWIEQREGLSALFTRIREDFPNAGFILDGLSNDTTKGWTTEWMSLDAELEMATDIKARCPSDMPVLFSVGRTLAEAITLVDAADMFIAPSGSGMTLYKWISNLPGLAFSNRAVLDEASGDKWALRVWHNPLFRADISETTHLPADAVQDEALDGQHHTRLNFHMDWRRLYEAAAPIIRSLPPRLS